jgi:exopolysaccharide production protein ExoZ
MRQILPIQALRGLAALSVAALHITQASGAFVGTPGHAPYAWMRSVPWEAGVDVFFVISGFVIVYASAHMFGHAGNISGFLVRRFARVVPLYWLVTSALILAALLGPVALNAPLGDGARYIAASYLFIPWPRPDGVMQPVFRLGWTLDYEMLFYFVVALFLPLRRRLAMALAATAIIVIALAGALLRPTQPQLAFWSDPIVIEFVFGVLIAACLLEGVRLARWARLALLIAGLAMLALDGTAHGIHRALGFGVPAACIVAAAALGAERQTPPALAWLFVLLGDASYALYLTHLFPTRALREIGVRLHLAGGIGIAVYILASLIAASALALAVNAWFEKPATRTARLVLRAA